MRKHKGITRSEAEKQVASNLVYAALLVRHGYADGTLSGSVETTTNVVKTALWVIGKATNVNTVSSCFLICDITSGEPDVTRVILESFCFLSISDTRLGVDPWSAGCIFFEN